MFVNHRESAARTYEFLRSRGVPAVLYHGDLDQQEREKAVTLFNNGSRPVLVATDLAARGLDIQDVRSVIHYHQPLTPEAYTHRNGRTARVDNEGDIYLLVGPEERVRDFVEFDSTLPLEKDSRLRLSSEWETLFFSAGRREKLSKGDILGFLVKEGGASPEDIGRIDVADHYALSAVRSGVADDLLRRVRGKKIKGAKRLISIVS